MLKEVLVDGRVRDRDGGDAGVDEVGLIELEGPEDEDEEERGANRPKTTGASELSTWAVTWGAEAARPDAR